MQCRLWRHTKSALSFIFYFFFYFSIVVVVAAAVIVRKASGCNNQPADARLATLCLKRMSKWHTLEFLIEMANVFSLLLLFATKWLSFSMQMFRNSSSFQNVIYCCDVQQQCWRCIRLNACISCDVTYVATLHKCGVVRKRSLMLAELQPSAIIQGCAWKLLADDVSSYVCEVLSDA